jgi:hypothetical protein
MTPFMHSVQGLLDGDPAPRAVTIPSVPGTVPAATDAQVIIRSLAEQLVSEANAVLRQHGEVVSLRDEVGPGGLAFTLGYRERTARVQTAMSGRSALVRLITDEDATGEDITGEGTAGEPRQLSSEAELQALLLSLIAAGPRH